LEEKSDRCFGVMDRNLSEVRSQLKTYFTKTRNFVFISRKRTKQTINCALMKSFSLPRTRLCNTPGRLRTTQPQSANSTLPHGGNMDVRTSKIMWPRRRWFWRLVVLLRENYLQQTRYVKYGRI